MRVPKVFLALFGMLALIMGEAWGLSLTELNKLLMDASLGNGASLQRLKEQAEKGDAKAQMFVGDLYLEGYGVPKDYQEAVKWYRRAAEKKEGAAMYNLGIMYEQGKGVRRSYKNALEWFRSARGQGIHRAGEAVARIESSFLAQILSEPVEEDIAAPAGEATSLPQIEQRAEREKPVEQLVLGADNREARSAPSDETDVVNSLRKAAEQGSANAQTSLGLMYLRGLGLARDFGEAARLFWKAATQGDAQGQYYLGLMYETGLGVLRDSAEAGKLYRMAAAQGHVGAATSLAALTRRGSSSQGK